MFTGMRGVLYTWETGTRRVFPTGVGGFHQRRHLARRRKGAATTESIPFQRV